MYYKTNFQKKNQLVGMKAYVISFLSYIVYHIENQSHELTMAGTRMFHIREIPDMI